MIRAKGTFWRKAARSALVPLFAWLLVAQAVAMPLVRARALENLGPDAALAVLCSATLPGDAQEGNEPRKVQDMGCCTLCSRLDLDLPVALPAPAPALPTLVPRPATRFELPPQGRAPPGQISGPLQARAPPALT